LFVLDVLHQGVLLWSFVVVVVVEQLSMISFVGGVCWMPMSSLAIAIFIIDHHHTREKGRPAYSMVCVLVERILDFFFFPRTDGSHDPYFGPDKVEYKIVLKRIVRKEIGLWEQILVRKKDPYIEKDGEITIHLVLDFFGDTRFPPSPPPPPNACSSLKWFLACPPSNIWYN
jgi:hypothetical protein